MALGRAHSLDSALVRTADVRISENVDFRSLLLSEPVLQGLTQAGFVRPSPIQLKAIPVGRYGLDLIVQAKSGTGKTCVFAVIALENIILQCQNVQVLILAPTREIAVQISQVILSIGACMSKLKCYAFIGGTPFSKDKFKLRQCHIAVGTPGRIKQLIEEGFLHTESVRLFVLDEADKLIADGFQETINWIYSCLPESKQMLALSATYPESLAQLLTRYMKSPTFVRLNATDPSLLGVKQYYSITPLHQLPQKTFDAKVDVLIQLLNRLSFNQCLVFSNFQAKAQMLASLLTSHGWPTMYLAGSQAQAQRLLAMASLQQYHCRILVSTDLTARGIDAEYVNLVVNMDVPMEADTYLHRIGRAGRFGTVAIAVTIVSEGKETEALFSIKNEANLKIELLPEKIDGSIWKAEKVKTVVEEMHENSNELNTDETGKEDNIIEATKTEENILNQETSADIPNNHDCSSDEHIVQESDSGDKSNDEANVIEISPEIHEGNKIGDYLTVLDVSPDETVNVLQGEDANEVDIASLPAKNDNVGDNEDGASNIANLLVGESSKLHFDHVNSATEIDATIQMDLLAASSLVQVNDEKQVVENTLISPEEVNSCETFLISSEENVDEISTKVETEQKSSITTTSALSVEPEVPTNQTQTEATVMYTSTIEEDSMVTEDFAETLTIAKEAELKQPNRSKMLRHENHVSNKSDDTDPFTGEITIQESENSATVIKTFDETSSVNLDNDNSGAVSDENSHQPSLILAEGEGSSEACSSDDTKEPSSQHHDKLVESVKTFLPQLFQFSDCVDVPQCSYEELEHDFTEFLKKSENKAVQLHDEKSEDESDQVLNSAPGDGVLHQVSNPCCIHSYIEWVLSNRDKCSLSDELVKSLNLFLQNHELLTLSEYDKNECVVENNDITVEKSVLTERERQLSNENCDNETKTLAEQITGSCKEAGLATENNGSQKLNEVDVLIYSAEKASSLELIEDSANSKDISDLSEGDELSTLSEYNKNESAVENDNDKEVEKSETVTETGTESSNEYCDNETKTSAQQSTEHFEETGLTTDNNDSQILKEPGVIIYSTEKTSSTSDLIEDPTNSEDICDLSEEGAYRLPDLAEIDKQLVQQSSISLVETFLAEINNNGGDKDLSASCQQKLEKSASNADDSLTSGTLDKSSQETVVESEQFASKIPDSHSTGTKPKSKSAKCVKDNASTESSDNESTSTTTEEMSATDLITSDSGQECTAADDNPLKNYFNWLNLGQKANAMFETEGVGHKTKDKSHSHNHGTGDGWWQTIGSLSMPPPIPPSMSSPMPPPPSCPCFMNQYYFWNMYFRQHMKPCNTCACCSYWNYRSYKLQTKKPSSKHK